MMLLASLGGNFVPLAAPVFESLELAFVFFCFPPSSVTLFSALSKLRVFWSLKRPGSCFLEPETAQFEFFPTFLLSPALYRFALKIYKIAHLSFCSFGGFVR